MFKQILLPVDKYMFSSKVIPEIESLSLCQGSEVTLLSVGDKSEIMDEAPSVSEEAADGYRGSFEKNLAFIADGLKSKGVNVKWAYREGSPSEEIVKYCDEIKCDLIALATHDRSMVSWIFGSDSVKIMSGSKVPVIVTKISEDQDISGRLTFVGP